MFNVQCYECRSKWKTWDERHEMLIDENWVERVKLAHKTNESSDFCLSQVRFQWSENLNSADFIQKKFCLSWKQQSKRNRMSSETRFPLLFPSRQRNHRCHVQSSKIAIENSFTAMENWWRIRWKRCANLQEMEKNQHVKTISHSIQKRCRDWRSQSGKNAKAHSSVKHLITHTNRSWEDEVVGGGIHSTTAPVLSDMQEKSISQGVRKWKRRIGWKPIEECSILLNDSWEIFEWFVTPRLAFIYIGTVNINQRATLNRKLKKVSNEKWNFSHFCLPSLTFFSFIEHSFRNFFYFAQLLLKKLVFLPVLIFLREGNLS